MLKKFALATLLMGTTSIVLASPLENLTVKVGASYLSPTADSLGMEATSEFNFTPSLDYRFAGTPFSVEVLLALPFNQGVKAVNGGEVASLKHLPPTVTAKFNLPLTDAFTVYAGAGATVFVPWDEELKGAPNTKLEADVAVGAAGQLGFNFKPADAKNWGVYGDVRYADLKTDLKVAGADIGSLEIDPLVLTLGYSFNF